MISADTSEELAERVEEESEEGESRSATIKRLLRAGIQAENSNEGLRAITTGMIVGGVVGIILALDGQIGPLSIAFSVAITAAGLITNYVTNTR